MSRKQVRACSVVGLGKLGAPLAAVLARAGLDVVGVDRDPSIVDAMAAGRAPHPEPGLQTALDRGAGRIRATTDLVDAVRGSTVSFVIVPTPSDSSGAFRNDLLVTALESIGSAIAAKGEHHVVGVVSTVMPGSTEAELAPALEQTSGRRVGGDLGLCYCPVFVALGSVVHDVTHPDLVLVGESDARAGDAVVELMRSVCESDPVVQRMTWINAEVAKLAVNTLLTTKISYANMLSEICERLPGADVDIVTRAVGRDGRIGEAYLRAATPYGGPCFPRDNAALNRAAEELGVEATLATATDRINRRQAGRIASIAADHAAPDDRIAVLGIAYKPNTPVTEESAGLAVAYELLDAGFEVVCFDPAVAPGADLGRAELKIASGIEECVQDAQVVVVTTCWPEFADLPATLARRGARPVIVDCWRMFGEHDELDVVVPGTGLPTSPTRT